MITEMVISTVEMVDGNFTRALVTSKQLADVYEDFEGTADEGVFFEFAKRYVVDFNPTILSANHAKVVMVYRAGSSMWEI